MLQPIPSCVFRLLRHGLVVIESEQQDERCSIYRPLGVGGTRFPGWVEGVNVGQRGTFLCVDAPPVDLSPVGRHRRKRWLVDISTPAAPGPGPVWFHEEFATAEDAVEAIRGCYFSDRVDFHSESLGPWKQHGGA
jgi:hypothetical protein